MWLSITNTLFLPMTSLTYVALITVFLGTISSQTKADIKWGFWNGVDLGYTTGINTNATINPGFIGGPYFIFSKNQRSLFSFEVDALFSMKGAYLDETTTIPGIYRESIKGALVLDYIEVPMLFRFALLKKQIGMNVFVGPGLAFLISTPGTFDITYEDLLSGNFVRAGEDPNFWARKLGHREVNRISADAIMGLGVTYEIGKFEMKWDIRFSHGLIPVEKKFSATVEGPVPRAWEYTRTLSIMVGVGL